MPAWQTKETNGGVEDCRLSQTKQSDSKERTKSHHPSQTPQQAHACFHTLCKPWGKPALHPPFLTSHAMARTELQGHKLTHKALFCLIRGQTWCGKEKPAVALEEKGQGRRLGGQRERQRASSLSGRSLLDGWKVSVIRRAVKNGNHTTPPQLTLQQPNIACLWRPFLGCKTGRSTQSLSLC